MTTGSPDGTAVHEGDALLTPELPRTVVRALAAGGAALSFLAIVLPWWHGGGRWAGATSDGLHPKLSFSLVGLTLAGAAVAFRATRRAGGRLDVFHAAVGILATIGVLWSLTRRWGSADRGIGQPVALIGAVLVVAAALVILAPPAPPSHRRRPTRLKSRAVPPAPALTADAFPFWFYVLSPEPVYGPDGQAVVTTLAPGSWYLATALASPGWVLVSDDAQRTGQLREAIASAGRQ